MFLSKYNKGDFIFALTFTQRFNIFCSSCTNTRTHSSAGLMGLESRNNPRSIFRKCWNEKCVRSSQLPVSRAALAQSLWCCSELLGMESLPWTLQSVMWKPLQLDQNTEPGTENLYNKILALSPWFLFHFLLPLGCMILNRTENLSQNMWAGTEVFSLKEHFDF